MRNIQDVKVSDVETMLDLYCTQFEDGCQDCIFGARNPCFGANKDRMTFKEMIKQYNELADENNKITFNEPAEDKEKLTAKDYKNLIYDNLVYQFMIATKDEKYLQNFLDTIDKLAKIE